jgi:hypothetical protein
MATASATLMVRLDEESKSCIAKAAELRHIVPVQSPLLKSPLPWERVRVRGSKRHGD